MDEVFYDIPALAKRLQCSNATAYAMVKTKRIPCVRIGNRYRIIKSNVDNFLQGGGSVAPSGPDKEAA